MKMLASHINNIIGMDTVIINNVGWVMIAATIKIITVYFLVFLKNAM
jgi:hypothetical protein